MRMFRPAVPAAFLSALAIAGCGDPSEWAAPEVVVTGMSVSPRFLSLGYVGETARVRAQFRHQLLGGGYDPANPPDIPRPEVTWSSSDTLVFTVDGTGLVTAVANGSAELFAFADRFSDTAFVMVEQIPRILEVVSGSDQQGRAGSTLESPVVVRVTDWGGAAVPGVSVSFAPEEGAGSVDPETAATDAGGLASTEWTLGDGVGEQSIRVEFDRGPAIWVTAGAGS
ncbi:MAG: hypothetical protein F4187_02675 [Gemmatimonadetes bacterium]|nr:hypothetical protein [Gemmatimonadota bacterium]MYI07377.1 hypothetical protein [Gemmatimonadota bacterium]